MIKYKTQQSPRERFYAPVGETKAPVYKEQLVTEKLEDGTDIIRKKLVKVGETDIVAKIQACKDDCDVYKILDRFTGGDVAALHRTAHNIYTDLTTLPRNIHEAVSKVDQAVDDFMSMPVEIRQAFNNDPEEFLAAARDKDKFAAPFLEFYKKHGVSHQSLEKESDKGDKKE